MKRTVYLLTTVAVFGGLVSQAAAQSKNRFRVNPSFTFNVDVDFRNITQPGTPGPAAGGAVNRGYQNGFVNIDSSGNAGGMTWNWGYNEANQFDAANGRLLFDAAGAGGTGVEENQSDGPHVGFDIGYGRVLGEVGRSLWGVEGGFGWTGVDITGGGSTFLTDAYAVAGTPPAAPYTGSFAGPGFTIGSTPTRGTTTAINSLDAKIYAFRLGPFIEIPLCEASDLEFGCGLAVARINSDFSVNQVSTVGGLTTSRSYFGSDSDTKLGGYLESRINYKFSDHWQAFGSARYQYFGEFEQNLGSRQAELSLGKAVSLAFGFGFSF